MKRIAIVLLIMLAISSVGVSYSAGQIEKPKYGGRFVASHQADANTLLPSTPDAYVLQFSAPIHNSLINLTPELQYIPELAESWDLSSDGLEYTFHLVKNATWHDGRPFTSADVKYTIEEIQMKLNSYWASVKEDIEGVDTPDDYTVAVRMKKPINLLVWLTAQAGQIVPKHIYDIGIPPLENPASRQPIGTGPYKFEEWVRADYVKYVRNENYWKAGKPYFDEVVIKVIPEGSVAMTALEKGEIDMILGGLVAKELPRLKSDPKIGVNDDATGHLGRFTMSAMHFNLLKEDSPFQDVRVRKAIAYAIDLEKMFEFHNAGQGVMSQVPFPRVFYGKDASEVFDRKWYPYDPDKANALLDEAGFGRGADGVRFRIDPYYVMVAQRDFAEVIPGMLSEVGIEANPVIIDGVTYYEKIFRKGEADKWEMVTGPYLMVPLDPIGGLGMYVHPDGGRWYGYDNGEVTSAVEQLHLSTTPQEERPGLYTTITRQILEDLPLIFVNEIWGQQSGNAWNNQEVEVPVYDAIQYSISAYFWENIYWRKGSVMEPEAPASFIANVAKKLQDYKAQFYDVSQAEAILASAQQALQEGDYDRAMDLARQAEAAVAPPYLLYGAIIVVIVVVVAVIVFTVKRRR